ncbi:MAG: helix-turn-helix domain-containing protein [Candidatus Omnitrophica bacterium]|nr:helix-turn-helix domain-containing protein [Candidatus Omnitrophota bacterium]
MKDIPVDKHLREKLKDPYFKELYELEQQKYVIVRKIVDYRIKNKISQAGLARDVGVSQQHISKIENGEFSSILTLEKVLLYIGMTVRIKAVELAPEVKKRLAARNRDK